MLDNNFIDLCIQGEALINDIDDYIAEWHKGKTKVNLQEYLGMNKEEYNSWLLDDTVINYIIRAHKEGKRFADVYSKEEVKIAARNGSFEQVQQLLTWLKDNE